jgi:iron complex outermembrane receptor protein
MTRLEKPRGRLRNDRDRSAPSARPDSVSGGRALSRAIRRTLAGVSTSCLALPATIIAQDAPGDGNIAAQDKLTVTGSRIKRVDLEGPQPLTVLSREDIEASGEISVAEVLRGTSFNTFGSYRQRSGSSAQSQAVVNLRGLGGQRTLVLIDGRRMSSSPSFNGGQGVNLNVLPLAAVERIEILRDGASAIYGSDAIGGVVNIILRRDYTGLQLSYGVGRPTQSGGDEDSYSIVGGITGAKGNVTFGFENEQKGILFDADRSFSATGLSSFGYPGSYFGFLTTNDPRNPAMTINQDTDGDGQADALGPTFLFVGTFPDPRCPSELGTPGFPESVSIRGRCRYNYAAVSATEASINTKSLFIDANYDIDGRTTFFARGLFTQGESFGRYATAPFTAPFFPFITQDNPNNPTNPVTNPTNALEQPFAGQSAGADTDGDGTADTTVSGPFDLSLFYRNTPGGTRDKTVEDTLVDYLAGVQGTVDWLGGMDWEFGAQYSKQTSDSDGSGYGLAQKLQSAIDDGSFDVFAANTDTGNAVDGFDPNFIAIAESGTVTTTQDNSTRIASGDFSVNFDAFRLRNGFVPVAVGVEYRDEDFNQNYDEQATAGNVQGSAGNDDASGARVVKALFAETTIPLLQSLDVNLAVRAEDYNDFGTTINPKISAAFRPLDSLLLRGSYGTGFRAPSMTELYTSTSVSFNGAIDSFRCALSPDGDPATGRDPNDTTGAGLLPGNPCALTQYQNLRSGNKDLDAEESTQWNVGLVWNPLDDLSVSLDWYDIELKDEVSTNPPMQPYFDQELALRNAGVEPVPFSTQEFGGLSGQRVGQVVRDPTRNNRVVTLLRPNANLDKRETNGLDLEASFSFGLAFAGDFRTTVQWTWINEYQVDNGDGFGLRDPPFFDPDHRGTIGLNWARGDFGANLFWNYMAGSSIEDANGLVTGQLDSFKTWDASANYTTPWHGTLTVGARNLFDEDPPTSDGIGFPYYSNYLHDVYGRVPYIRYDQEL